MVKISDLKEVLVISSVIGFVSELFITIHTAFIILLVLSTIDTITGITGAIKYKRFTSRGLGKLIKKVITYTACLVTVRLLELGVAQIVQTTIISQIMASFLILVEAVSILENLAFLGAPIPANFIPFLIEQFKIPGLNYVLKLSRSTEKHLEEVDEILKYQVATFEDKNVKNMLEIKFQVWISVIKQIDAMIGDNDPESDELLYYKVRSTAEFAFEEMENRWVEQGIPKKYYEKFKEGHQDKLDEWLNKIKTICFSKETLLDKKEQLMDSIKVLLYQTILDAHKEFR